MKKAQGGFTLIELVMVIVILGILAAVAMPKFIDLSTDAKTAAAAGAAGALSSQAAVNYAGHAVATSNGVSFAGSAAQVSALTNNMAGWDTKFNLSASTVGCGTAGLTPTVGVSHTGGGTSAVATLICTG